MLSDRRQRVLAALIEEYVSRALPVGSRTLVENYNLGVSSATVRNELSVLEDDGYITQPHTSAGRIPTDIGYRSFVDDLLKTQFAGQDLDEDARRAAENLRDSASELDDLIEKTTAALARFTNNLTIVLPPSTLRLDIKQITFVSLTPNRVLAIIVTEDGQVLNRHIEFVDEVDSLDLAHAQEVLNRVFAGRGLAEIRADFDEETAELLHSPLVSVLFEEVLACLREGDTGHARRLGLSTMVKQPEFERAQNLMPVLEVLEDDTVLMQILKDSPADSTSVRIGHENAPSQLSGVSVIAGRYGRGASEGVVAVIGPTRMDYAQVIRAVNVARRALGDE
ncbi:MAG: heat-inducible transcriptional repressor HrcA [Eggerthellaceae bacterium]|nr:heat-inducible transcriptional repressor HrcA [Eggerthellaceae bacterium]